MGRFLAIVLVLVAVALLINKGMQNRPQPPSQEAVDPQAVAATDEKSADEPELLLSPATSAASESTFADKEPESPLAQSQPKGTPQPEPSLKTESVLLGSSDLLSGIPGEGALTAAQIDAWLDDSKNHVTLKPELPLGLAAGAAEIKGLVKNRLTRAKIELGRQLYFDTRLSSDNTISCASCHDPAFGFAKNTQFGIGVDGQQGGRNSPVAYNRILSGPQFWDGRAASLEAQAVGPIANPIEMANTHEACVKTLQGIDGYVQQFEAIFDDGVTIDNVGQAIASFERAIVTGPAPWDYYQQVAAFEKAYADDLAYIREQGIEKEQAKDEDQDELDEGNLGLDEEDLELWDEYTQLKEPLITNPISESAIRGGQLFFSDKAGCTACHLGANFADEKYHNLGVGMDAEEPDLGRFSETKAEKDRGAFKTPTVRNVSMTGPFMHDGSQQTLAEVVQWYAKGGHPNPHLSKNIKKLDLSEPDKKDLVAFMAEGLLGKFPQIEAGRLPE